MAKKEQLHIYSVSVEKKASFTGVVFEAALNEEAAIAQVRSKIDRGQIQTEAVAWSDPQYEDFSCVVTDEVESVGPCSDVACPECGDKPMRFDSMPDGENPIYQCMECGWYGCTKG